MGKISILDSDLVNKIAAGEVVERPASVVKELVENALDAGASMVSVSLENAGIDSITVVDDGAGMSPEDLELAVTRYGTSKISSIEDLRLVSSFGFRGEALASIASVSRFSLFSRQAEVPMGSVLRIDGSSEGVKTAGMPIGTRVVVSDLFYSVPARKKFLKSPRTELNHILDVVTGSALSSPVTGFLVSHNGKEVLNLPSKQTLSDRLKVLLGDDTAQRLIPVQYDHPHLRISGFVGKPEVVSTSANKQYLIVNGRRVYDRMMASAIKQAYGTLLMPRSYPVFALMIEMPQEMVDVNVHPRKEEVAFVNKGAVFGALKNAVSSALQQQDLTFGRTTAPVRDEYRPELKESPSKGPTSDTFSAPSPSMPQGSLSIRDRSHESSGLYVADSFINPNVPLDVQDVLQIHNLYLIQQTNNGVLLVDQHAAHERILYERFLKQYKDEVPADIQQLLIPQEVSLSKQSALLLRDNLSMLKKVGFSIEPLDSQTFSVSAVPAKVAGKDLVSLLTQFCQDLEDGERLREIDEATLRALTFLSCRSAIKAGDPLTQRERKDLLQQLDKCTRPYTCPHGRPVMIELSLKELEKMFKRVV